MRIFSEEHRRKLSESAKGRIFSQEIKDKMSVSQRGRKHTEETKKKISDGNKGKVMSKESIEKMRVSMIGRKRTEISRHRQSLAIRGKKKSPEHIRKIVISRERFYELNPDRAEKRRRILSDYQRSLTKEQRKQRSVKGRLACMYAMKNNKRTSIEILVSEELARRNIKCIEQLVIGYYSVDFYLPDYNSVIECDGDYWHSTPKVINKDKKKDSWLRGIGISVFRIRERDIKSDVSFCVQSILDRVSK